MLADETMRLLLVEDDAMLGESVRRGLQQQGHAVDWVRDGEAADLAMASEPYDIVLLELSSRSAFLGCPRRRGPQAAARW